MYAEHIVLRRIAAVIRREQKMAAAWRKPCMHTCGYAADISAQTMNDQNRRNEKRAQDAPFGLEQVTGVGPAEISLGS